MDKAFATFTKLYDNIFDIAAPERMDNFFEEIIKGCPAENFGSDREIFEKTTYLMGFETFVKFYEEAILPFPFLGNPAQIAGLLLKVTIEKNTDICVDAVQIPKENWGRAIEAALNNKNALFEIIDALFQPHWKLDFVAEKQPFNSIRDINPVKWLAFIRGAAWIRKYYPLGYSFDSTNTEHNLFLSATELSELEEAFKDKYCKLNDYVDESQLKDQEIRPGSELVFGHSSNLAITFNPPESFPGTSQGCFTGETSVYSSTRRLDDDDENQSADFPQVLSEDDFDFILDSLSSSNVAQIPDSLISVTFLANNSRVKLEQNGIENVISCKFVTKAKLIFDAIKSEDLKKADEKSAQVFFDGLFSENEILMGSLKGRNDTVPLCKQKCTAIYNAVALLHFLGNCESVQNADTFSIPPLCNFEERNIEKTVFTEYRYRRSEKIKNPETQKKKIKPKNKI